MATQRANPRRLLQQFALLTLLGLGALPGQVRTAPLEPVYPGADWARRNPEEVGLREAALERLRDLAGGSGCVVRYGYLVYTWGQPDRRADVASAVKPLYTHLLLLALQDQRIASLDARLTELEPGLATLNAALDHKDRDITWRHLCNQISCYGVRERPGTAFDYSDYNMALFFDTLMLRVYQTPWEHVDRVVLHPRLTDPLQCQDQPTFMAFGTGNRPGRLAISPRDFARFGLLYLRGGEWKNATLLSPELVRMAVSHPLPLSVPRTAGEAADMLPGQRSIGGGNNQCDHEGSYSYAWWVNGIRRDGQRSWPAAPPDTYGCFGHGDIRAMIVIPSQHLIVSWNDTRLEGHAKVNEALALLLDTP